MSSRNTLRVVHDHDRVDLAAAETAAAQFLTALGVCEHHLLPFVGVAHVGYLPADRILTLDGAPLVMGCSRRSPLPIPVDGKNSDARVTARGSAGRTGVAGVVVVGPGSCHGSGPAAEGAGDER